MSILEDFEKKTGYEPITPEIVSAYVLDAEDTMRGVAREPLATVPCGTLRVLVWLSDRVIEHATAQLEGPKLHACGWCWKAAGATPEAWEALPKVALEESQTHVQTCEHNPLVARVRELEAAAEDIRGRALGLDDGLRDAIRGLLKSEMTAGELRRALGELVR